VTGRIPVGYVVRAHGIKGDVLVRVLSDDPDRFVLGAVFECAGHDGPLTVAGVRPHKTGLVLALEEVPDRTAAERLAKSTLTISAADRRLLEDGEFWPDDLVGLTAVTGDGVELGRVVDVVTGTAQDRLVVDTTGGQTVEVPFVTALVDPPGDGSIVVRPPAGLFAPEPPDQV
jgi:16S rRNA processing protein RimM